MSLNWESTYAIALELRRQHPEINIEVSVRGRQPSLGNNFLDIENAPRKQACCQQQNDVAVF